MTKQLAAEVVAKYSLTAQQRNAQTRAEIKADQLRYAAMGVGMSATARAVRATRRTAAADVVELMTRLAAMGDEGVRAVEMAIASVKS